MQYSKFTILKVFIRTAKVFSFLVHSRQGILSFIRNKTFDLMFNKLQFMLCCKLLQLSGEINKTQEFVFLLSKKFFSREFIFADGPQNFLANLISRIAPIFAKPRKISNKVEYFKTQTLNWPEASPTRNLKFCKCQRKIKDNKILGLLLPCPNHESQLKYFIRHHRFINDLIYQEKTFKGT